MTQFTDLYLRADTEQDAIGALTQAGLLHLAETGDGETALQPVDGVTYDPIGIIYEPGTYDEKGKEVKAPVALEGWHANIRLVTELTQEQADVLAPVTLAEPNQPVRVFG